MPFNDSWIGWSSYLDNRSSAITASGTSDGFNPSSLANWMPWDFWQGDTGSGYVQVDCGDDAAVNYLAIAAHNFNFTGADFELLGSDDVGFSSSTSIESFGPITQGSNVLCFKFNETSFRYYRLAYTGSSTPVRIGVIALGKRMEFERGFYGGFTPPKWNDESEVLNNKSEGGVFLGRSILRSSVRPISIQVEPVSHQWVEDTWLPFKEHATLKPFFLAWGNVPTENNVFAVQGSWAPSKLRNRRLASVGMSFEGVTK